jgi:hypothetical protein
LVCFDINIFPLSKKELLNYNTMDPQSRLSDNLNLLFESMIKGECLLVCFSILNGNIMILDIYLKTARMVLYILIVHDCNVNEAHGRMPCCTSGRLQAKTERVESDASLCTLIISSIPSMHC